MKKILVILISLIMMISCVQGNIDIDFKDYNKGNAKINVKVAKDYEQYISGLLKKDNIDLTKYEVETGHNDVLGDYTEYKEEISFNSLEELKSKEIILNQLTVENLENNIYKVSFPKNEFLTVQFTVNGKILESKSGNIENNKIVFLPGENIEFTYELNNYALFKIAIISIIILIFILLLVAYIIKKIRNKKEINNVDETEEKEKINVDEDDKIE